MYRWTAKAVLLGLAINDASGNPLIPESLSLSSTQAQLVHEHEEDNGFNDGTAVLEWLSQCAGANIDSESCLVSKTLDTLITMGDGPSQDDDGSFPTRRRFLQEEGECRPELSEQDLRFLMAGSRAECNEDSIEYTDQYFEGVLSEFWKIFSSESCWNELCNSPDIFVKLMFDHAMQCANVEFDVDECITDQIFSMLAGADSYNDDGDDYYNYTDDYYNYTDNGMTISSPNHRVLRSLQDVMTDSHTDCVEINEFELAYFASFILMEAEGRCAELGVSLTPEDISKASADLVKLFASPHCFGDAHPCPDEGNDEEGNDVVDSNHSGGQLDHFAIGVKYVEQCANIDLNLDSSCLTTKTFDFFKSLESSPTMHKPRQLQESEGGEEDCIVPDIDDALLNAVTFEAKQQCIASTGTPISDDEYSSSVEVMRQFLGAQSCWQSLCEEGDNPSRMLLEIVFEEIGICSQADLDAIDPCLLNQIFELLFNSNESPGAEGGIGDLRRKLQRSLSDQNDMPIPNEPSGEPCVEQPDDAELYFVINLLLAGASESCDVSSSQVSTAESELFKLFRAESCWGESSSGCEHDGNSPVEASYLEFVENNAVDMLAQCAEVTDATSCVFWRSLETLRFMGGGGDAQGESSFGNGPLLQHAFQEAASNICIPPSITDDDINQIVDHAKDHCVHHGLPVESHHTSNAVADLKKLVAKPDCFEDLCSAESREMIVEEWLFECASLDTRFLTRPSNHWSDYSSQPLDNDTLRCMTRYLMQSQTGFQDPWECGLPQISPSICGVDPTNPSDIMKEAFMYCSGGETSHPPSPSPEMSMSFGYNEGDLGNLDNWDDYVPDVGDTFDFSMSMSYSWWQGVGQNTGNHHEHDDGNTSAMLPYVLEVCHLLGDLDSDQPRECLKPVCDWGVVGALTFDDSDDMVVMEYDATDSPTIKPSMQPTRQPTGQPTGPPTLQPTRQPTQKPTQKPTSSPTSSPTVLETGVVEVKFEVAITLSGIETSDIDVTQLDSVKKMLEDVIEEMLPDGAEVRITKVGGFSLTRRMLQEDSSEGTSLGVDVEFEVIFTETCSEEECNDAKEIEDSLLQEADAVSSDIAARVEDGSITASIQQKAAEQDIEVMKSISVNEVKVSEPSATVIIKKEQEEEVPDDDDSAAPVQGYMNAMALAIVAFAATLV